MSQSSSSWSRRSFITAGVAPFFIGGCRLFSAANVPPRRVAPSARVNIAMIGCGTQCFDNCNQFLHDPRVRVAVTCDPVKDGPFYHYDAKHQGGCVAFKRIVDDFYGNHDCRAVTDWREVVEDPTIDAVCVATPDHWHAIISIAAMRHGKHVYCQKPMTLSIAEGRAMANVQKETGCVLQVGNQGRADSRRRIGAELAVNGYVGKIVSATVTLPAGCDYRRNADDPKSYRFPDYFESKDLWDLWQGPAQHWADDAFIPAIHRPMCWRWNRRYGGGMITDFGGHEFDTLQWGLGMNESGPVGIENFRVDPNSFSPCGPREIFSWAGRFSFDIVYRGGTRVHVINIDPEHPRQVVFKGESGEEVGFRGSTMVRPARLKKWKETDLRPTDTPLYRPANRHSHESDFIDGIYENRPIGTNAEIGHRNATVCHLANICETLGVSSLGWDPDTERFTGPNADAAQAYYGVPYANGWSLGA